MKGLVAGAARRPVFANLLMVLLLVGGALSLQTMRRERFPEFTFDEITVTIPYPDATPADVESGIALPVEEAIRGVDGVRKVLATCNEGALSMTIEVDPSGRDKRDVLQDIKDEIDRIDTFPAQAEDPTVALVLRRDPALKLALYGPLDELSLKIAARRLEEALLRLDVVEEVSVEGLRLDEISVELRTEDLRRYGLSLADVGQAIAGSSLDLPAGALKTDRQELVIRTQGLRYRQAEYEALEIVRRADGTKVLLRDIADVRDGFVDRDLLSRFDGERAAVLTVMKGKSQDMIEVVRSVRDFAEGWRPTLPEGLELALWSDSSRVVTSRLQLLAENGLYGLFLVFGCLFIFLNTRLSLWVAAGIPVAFFAALWFLGATGNSMNMITSFAFIMALGIVVDDAIVVAENVHRHQQQGDDPVEAAVQGTLEVFLPVLASTATTIAAFAPLFFVEGRLGKFMQIMPVAVITCLLGSLIECLLILPAHLAHRPSKPRATWRRKLRGWLEARIDSLSTKLYAPLARVALRHRMLFMVGVLAVLLLTGGMMAGGTPSFVFFPQIDGETMTATIDLPRGTPFAATREVARQLEDAALALKEHLGPASDGDPAIRHIYTVVGAGGAHQARLQIELAPSELRGTPSVALLKDWRERIGALGDDPAVVFTTGRRHGGQPIDIQLTGPDGAVLEAAAQEIKEHLSSYEGVYSIEDNLLPGKPELQLVLKPLGEALGLRLRDLAGQMYRGLSGDKALTVVRGREDVEVRVRLAKEERSDYALLEETVIRTADGRELPLKQVAELRPARGYGSIQRRDGQRIVSVRADVDERLGNAGLILTATQERCLVPLTERHVGLRFSLEGEQEERAASLGSMFRGFMISLLAIYGILAVLFRSYVQPLIVMAVIPIGFVGAVLGHAAMGLPLTLLSLFGLVGLSGIVVNDSLVLIDFINAARARGLPPAEAAFRSGILRFRAITLTTVTTVAGLTPLVLETSLQAQFLVPMAVSISAGVMFATLVTLFFVPCAYLMITDLKALWDGSPAQPPLVEAEA